MPDTASSEAVYALLIDGTPVRIRALGPGDLDAVRDLHRGMSPDNLYLRFFGYGPGIADEVAAHLCQEQNPARAALGLWLAGDLVGVAEYDPTGEGAWRRSRSPSPTTCTAAASVPSCWSTWCRWPASAASASSAPRR